MKFQYFLPRNFSSLPHRFVRNLQQVAFWRRYRNRNPKIAAALTIATLWFQFFVSPTLVNAQDQSVQPSEEEFAQFMSAPVDQTTGLIIPAGFDERIIERNLIAEAVQNQYDVFRLSELAHLDDQQRTSFIDEFAPDAKERLADVFSRSFVGESLETAQQVAQAQKATLVDPDSKAVDFRRLNFVSPVKYQGLCGSCWAFAVTGAFESSWAIHNHGEKITVSEEALLTCGKSGSCQGGTAFGFDYILTAGIPTDKEYPYKEENSLKVDSTCPPGGFHAVYKAENWRFVTNAWSLPDVRTLKKALAFRGPLYACIIATEAFKHNPAGQVFSEQTDSKQGINHAILIVGWDDDKGAWLIKNSWSQLWGEKGYIWVKYGSNKVGLGAAYVTAQSKKFPLDYKQALGIIISTPDISIGTKGSDWTNQTAARIFGSTVPRLLAKNRSALFLASNLSRVRKTSEPVIVKVNPDKNSVITLHTIGGEPVGVELPFQPGTGFTWSKGEVKGDVAVSEKTNPTSEDLPGKEEFKTFIITPHSTGISKVSLELEGPVLGKGPAKTLTISLESRPFKNNDFGANWDNPNLKASLNPHGGG
jgi:C1A family cysteine protease